MWDDRWQMISRDTSDIFGIIRGDQTWLSTVEMVYLGAFDEDSYFKYESCLFTKKDSEVLRRYKTRAEATTGHIELAKKYNLA